MNRTTEHKAQKQTTDRLFLTGKRSLVGLVWISTVMGLFGCPPKLYINNSFRQAVEVPVASGMLSLGRGESIEIKEIIKVENATPAKMAVTQLFGVYFLAADGFQWVWRLEPAGRDRASYTKVEIPGGGKLRNPQFLHSENHNCVELKIGEAGAEKQWYIHFSGQVAGRCSDVSSN